MHAFCDDGITELSHARRAPKQFLSNDKTLNSKSGPDTTYLQVLNLAISLALGIAGRHPLPFLPLLFNLLLLSHQSIFRYTQLCSKRIQITFALADCSSQLS